jgi:GT2 family glycosyltransferase
VLLSEASTQQVLIKKNPDEIRYSTKDKNFFNSLRIEWLRRWMAPFYKTSGSNTFYVKGCNMAFWKQDLLKVNGYNESFFGWGREDSELAIRLRNVGVKKQFLKMGGICYHLHHRETSRELEPQNTAMMNDAIANKIIWAKKGLNQYLPD